MRKRCIQGFFADKRIVAWDSWRFSRATIVGIGGMMIGLRIVLLFDFRRNHHATGATAKKPGEGLGSVSLYYRFPTRFQNLLHLGKQFLCNEWLVGSFVDLASVTKQADVEGIREDMGNNRSVKLTIAPGYQPFRLQKVRNVFQPRMILRIELIGCFENGTFLWIDIDGFGANVVEISNGGTCRKHTIAHFLPEASFRILRERVHVILALAKGNLEHKFALWRRLKPKRGELHGFDFFSIHKID